jgi:hypothetical protein
MLRGVEVQPPVSEFDAAVGLACNVRVVRDHQNRVACLVQFAKDFQDDFFIGFIQIAGGLVGQDNFRLID